MIEAQDILRRAKTVATIGAAASTKGGTSASRIRFVAAAPPGAVVLAKFLDPAPRVAIIEWLDLQVSPIEPSSSDPMEPLEMLVVPAGDPFDAANSDWLASPGTSETPCPVSISFGEGHLFWRPGRLVADSVVLNSEALVAIAEFAFYEAELRRLESAIPPFETSAMADARDAYRISSSKSDQWARFGQIMESLAVLRLSFARLEPRLLSPSRALPAPARRLVRRLSRVAMIEDRLSGLTDRLEACEDLYEGAVDRITDHRWSRRGTLLEIIIVVLLLLEVLQLGGDMALRWITPHLH